MARIDRYLIRLFVVRVVLITLALLSLYVAIDLIEKLRWVTRDELPTTVYLRFFWYRAPLALSQLLPLSAMLAATLTLAGLNRRNELTALRAAGIAPARIFVPLLGSSAAVGALLFAATEFWVPQAFTEAARIEQQVADRRWKPPTDRIRWYSQGPYRFRAGLTRSPDVRAPAELLSLDAEGRPLEHLISPEARWDGHLWRIDHGERWRFEGDGAQLEPVGPIALPISSSPAELDLSRIDPETLRWNALRKLVERGRSEGFDVRGLATALELRLLLPLACLVLTLIGAPAGARAERSSSLTASLARALALATVYLVVTGATLLIAQRSDASTSALIWLPQAGWLAAGIVALMRLR